MEQFTRDFDAVVKKARLLAIQFTYSYIHTDHFFTAMLSVDCEASVYLTGSNIVLWEERLEQRSPKTAAPATLNGSVPLTMEAERMVRHAINICAKVNKKKTSTVHLLLALVSANNAFSQELKKSGVIFEDIVETTFGVKLAKFTPALDMPIVETYSKWKRLLMPKTFFQEKAQQLYIRANTFLEYQQYEQCIKVCDDGLKFLPSYQQFNILKAYAFYKERNYKKAADLFASLVSSFPENENYKSHLAYCYSNQGQHALAMKIFDAALIVNPQNADILNNKGFDLLTQEKHAESVPFLEEAIKINPNFAFPYNNLGYAKYKLGLINEGMALIDKSLELDEGNSFAYKYKGIIYAEQHNPLQAFECFELALKYGYTENYGDEVKHRLKNLQ